MVSPFTAPVVAIAVALTLPFAAAGVGASERQSQIPEPEPSRDADSKPIRAARRVSVTKLPAWAIDLTISPDHRRYAYVSDTKTVVADGKSGPEYDEATRPLFSRDGRRLAYLARRGGKWLAVLDGEESEAYDEIRVDSLGFSTDGSNRLRYLAKSGERWSFVSRGPGGRVLALPEAPPREVVYGPDALHVAYVTAAPDGNRYVLVDGVPGPPCSGAGLLALGAGGREAYYAVRPTNGVDLFVVFGGRIGTVRGSVTSSGIAISPDGRHFAYSVQSTQHGGRDVLVVDDVAGWKHQLSPTWDLQFSPDGKRLAFAARGAVALDGAYLGPFADVQKGSLTFSPDGAVVAFAAEVRQRDRPGHRREWRVVTDDGRGNASEGASYGEILPGSITFGPDGKCGKRLAYLARTRRPADGRGPTRLVLVAGRSETECRPMPGTRPAFHGPDDVSVIELVSRGGGVRELVRLEVRVRTDDDEGRRRGR